MSPEPSNGRMKTFLLGPQIIFTELKPVSQSNISTRVRPALRTFQLREKLTMAEVVQVLELGFTSSFYHLNPGVHISPVSATNLVTQYYNSPYTGPNTPCVFPV